MAAEEEKLRQKLAAELAEKAAAFQAIRDRNKEGLVTAFYNLEKNPQNKKFAQERDTLDGGPGWLPMQWAAYKQCSVKVATLLLAAYPEAVSERTKPSDKSVGDELPIHLACRNKQLLGNTEKEAAKLIADKEGLLVLLSEKHPEGCAESSRELCVGSVGDAVASGRWVGGRWVGR